LPVFPDLIYVFVSENDLKSTLKKNEAK
jgi:hypothetical protein